MHWGGVKGEEEMDSDREGKQRREGEDGEGEEEM